MKISPGLFPKNKSDPSNGLQSLVKHKGPKMAGTKAMMVSPGLSPKNKSVPSNTLNRQVGNVAQKTNPGQPKKASSQMVCTGLGLSSGPLCLETDAERDCKPKKGANGSFGIWLKPNLCPNRN
jgi:hypothetical protein